MSAPTQDSAGGAAPVEEDSPTLLVVGGGDPMETALLAALDRYEMFVETATAREAVNAVFTAAPDLVVLLGEAAAEEGGVVLRALAASAATSVIPVAILSDDAALDARLRAFRHGAVAVVPRSASVDEMARRVAELARELPERPGAKGGIVGEATIDELVDLLATELRSGILSVTQAGKDGKQASARFVLRADRPVTDAVEAFLERLKPMIEQAQPLEYEFHESSTGQLEILDAETGPEEGADDVLQGRRILLIDNNPATADALAQELRSGGALVVVTDGEGAGFERAKELDPQLVMIDELGLDGWGYGVMSRLRRDPRLRWAAVLVLKRAELWSDGVGGPDMAKLAEGVRPLVRQDDQLRMRVLEERSFEARLELVGPSRMLHAFATAPFPVHLTIRHPRAVIDLDVTEGLLVGARCRLVGGRTVEGFPAAAAAMALSSARVRVERRENPSTANIMTPVAEALAVADREVPPIQPSLPPPSLAPDDTAQGHAPAGELIEQLEQLLGQLRHALPADAERAAVVRRVADVRSSAESARRNLPRPKPRPARKKTLLGQPPGAAAQGGSTAAPAQGRPEERWGQAAPADVGGRTDPAPPPQPEGSDASNGSEARGADILGADTPSVSDARSDETVRDLSLSEVMASSDARSRAPDPAAVRPPAPPPPAPPPPTEGAVAPRVDALARTEAALEPVVGVAASPAPRSEGSSPTRHPRAAALDRLAASVGGPLSAARTRVARYPWGAAPGRLAALVRRLLSAARIRGARLPKMAAAGVGLAAVLGLVAFAVLGSEEAPPEETASAPPDPEMPAGGERPTEPAPAGSAAPAVALSPDGGAAPETGAAGSQTTAADGGGDGLAEGAADAGSVADAARDAGATGVAPRDIPLKVPGLPLPRNVKQRVEQLVVRGNYQRRHGKTSLAEQYYMEALRHDSSNARAMVGLIKLYMSKRHHTNAVRWARRLVEARPESPANHVLLGDALKRAGELPAAREAWRQAVQVNPRFRPARRRLRDNR